MHARDLKPKAKTKSTARGARIGGRTLLSSTAVRKLDGVSSLGKTVHATQAKNRFGEILKSAREVGPVFIERHGQPQAVLLDFKTYQALVTKKRSPDEKQLDALRARFEELFASMQKPAARKVADRFLSASAEELNTVARRARGRA